MAALVNLRADATALQAKEQTLFACLQKLGRVIVAYSGGTDSAYLAWAAHHVLGDDAVAVTADSASIPASHKRDAEAFARECGFRHEYIETHEFENPDYVKNDKNRCFHCKDELFTRLESFAARRGNAPIVYGVNKDDLGDYRPGQRAAKLHGVQAPLVEAGLTKAEIRELSRRAGLSTWDRPAAACLSSRVPYGTPVTPQTIQHHRAGRRGDSRPRIPPVSRPLSRRARAHRNRERRTAARPHSGNRASLLGDLQAARFLVRHARSRRLPSRLVERRAAGHIVRRIRRAWQTLLVRRFDWIGHDSEASDHHDSLTRE